jgi:hypothetical protein
MTNLKLKRGQKLCPECGGVSASRSFICKYCRHEFVAKKTPIKNEIMDWKNLEIDTYIKVVQGTGPYFLAQYDSEDGRAGERIRMGHTGVFKVVGMDNKGLHTYGASHKNAGFAFIYMGPTCVSPHTGMNLEPHRIKQVRKRKIRDKNVKRNGNSHSRK